MASNTFSKAVTDWQLLVATVVANTADLPHLEPTRLELAAVLQLALELGVQQDRQHSETQQTSRVIEETMRRAPWANGPGRRRRARPAARPG